jgi:hypothetical protein
VKLAPRRCVGLNLRLASLKTTFSWLPESTDVVGKSAFRKDPPRADPPRLHLVKPEGPPHGLRLSGQQAANL